MTNGEKIKQMFPNIEVIPKQIDIFGEPHCFSVKGLDGITVFTSLWWNAKYEEPSDTKTITISKGAVKHGNKDYVVYKRDWLMEHLDSEFEVLKEARKLGEKIKNAKPSTWLTDGLTQEEVAEIVTQSKNGAIRKCMNCKHYRMTEMDGKTYGACESWECKFEPKGVEE